MDRAEALEALISFGAELNKISNLFNYVFLSSLPDEEFSKVQRIVYDMHSLLEEERALATEIEGGRMMRIHERIGRLAQRGEEIVTAMRDSMMRGYEKNLEEIVMRLKQLSHNTPLTV